MNQYFDNASTSFPKPQAVADAMTHFLNEIGGTYGRAAYPRIVASTAIVEQCRDMVAERMGVSDSGKVFFYQNATAAANIILKGLGLHECRVLVSPLEHNAVMRPLQYISDNASVSIEVLPHNEQGIIDCKRMAALNMENVALIVVNHQSNVNGAIQPMAEITRAAQGVPIMVDLSQSLGATPCMIDSWGVQYAIFTGHKALYGPTGIGGFYAAEPNSIATGIHGGTGSRSDSYFMPESYPDRFEAGTPNMVGAAGLLAALENVPQTQHTFDDFKQLMVEIEAIEGISVHAATLHAADVSATIQGELFSITHRNIAPSVLCRRLFDGYSIETRQGLHCAPLSHRTLKTFADGTLRIAPSAYHTQEDFARLTVAIRSITKN